MIHIESLYIKEFRGIRNMELTLNGRSFLVWGPNGSGKSGVVDAIDFVLTGNISRLSGEGFGDIKIKEFGPHVTKRTEPALSEVSITVKTAKDGKLAKVTRNLSTPKKFTVEPDSAEIRSAIEKAQLHSEITLSRREIIKYIIAQPGNRAQYVQELLKLTKIDKTRQLFKSTQSKIRGAEKQATGDVVSAENALKIHLNLSTLNPDKVLEVVNSFRSNLDIPKIISLDLGADLSEGVDSSSSGPHLSRDTALREVAHLQQLIDDSESFVQTSHELAAKLKIIEADPSIRRLWAQRSLIAAGLEMVTEAACPLCDSEWSDIEQLREHLSVKQAQSKSAETLKEEIQAISLKVLGYLKDLRSSLVRPLSYVGTYGSEDAMVALSKWSTNLQDLQRQLESVTSAAIDIEQFRHDPMVKSEGVDDALAQLHQTLMQLPDDSTPRKATIFLTLAQERWSRLCEVRANKEIASRAATTFDVIYATYTSIADDFLENLYLSVGSDFARYYSILNKDDEASFSATLAPSSGKLDLSVDFYGQGDFPPAAYHSEGHQDGMGICLYLALMRRLHGQDFRVAVLDDVVMSVDTNHRRQFCQLLIEEFPDVQFILTTHDEVWARQIKSSGLVARENQARFYGWNVEDGPSHEDGEFWNRIDDELKRHDVPAAAARLRRNLEALLADLTDAISGTIAFRGDGKYELGDFKNSVMSQHSKLLKKAMSVAKARGDQAEIDKVKKLQDARVAIGAKLEDENWAVNTAVHYNEWENFSPTDFRPVVDVWRTFLAQFRCGNESCGSLISLRKIGQNYESLRCKCGAYRLDLS